MTKQLEIYKCNICGNVVQILDSGIGILMCCGEDMNLLNPQNDSSNEIMKEKHQPIINKEEMITTIKIEHHPQTNEHHINFLQCINKENPNKIYTQIFTPDEEIVMNINDNIESAISYCNIHNLYKS